ncbi:hypothetical protein ASG72_19015 [Bosea sp. Leaf344]|uniref:DUF2087 domain-containing protein n=1 Tax=Bosea sp. Leaf344 TaxID=1736346 RepID=UPI0006F84B2A|nr:DUF2087 domain-containing protein [Bosea sp. Leaf344]KQU50092.1 hypothetical protein ASG72_19015 [Bosea sp. Leaf344]
MSRTPIPFAADDLSALARSLREALSGRLAPPGHVEMLNLLARAAGHRNYQHLRAQSEARERLAAPAAPPAAIDHLRILRTARHFDAEGRLERWPSRPWQRTLCLWVLWSAIPAAETFGEREISRLLDARLRFGDPALMRRELVDNGMVFRTDDCRVYRRIERRPPPEALALIRHLQQRVG